MTLDEVIADMRLHRENRSQSVYGSDRVYMLLDAYDAADRQLKLALETLTRMGKDATDDRQDQ